MRPEPIAQPPRRAFVDLDGVVVDFDGYLEELNAARSFFGHPAFTADDMKKMRGAYLAMKPLPGAIECVRQLAAAGFEVWLATKPPTAVPWAYADKVQWVLDWMPEFERRIILTHNKGLLGDRNDVLIDDNPGNSRGQDFKGQLIHFGTGMRWPDVLRLLLAPVERREAPVFWPAEAKGTIS